LRVTAVQIETLARGLGHPEGPDVLPDGRVVFVNTYTGEVLAWHALRGTTRYGYTGGAPNACALGADGNVYVTQCPGAGAWVAPDRRPPSIQRITPDGTVDIVCSEIDGVAFDGPNDLAFAADGRLWFTDSGHWDEATRPDPGRIVAIDAQGRGEIVAELDHTFPNGIAAEPDGSVVWSESYTREIWRCRPDGERQRVCALPEGHVPDGLKIDAGGSYWITCVFAGVIDVVTRAGELARVIETGGVPLNCVFDGTQLLVTDHGPLSDATLTPMDGRLVRFETGVAGMARYRGSAEHGFAAPEREASS
jgi:gluconolactonase